jgi:hypothetical protein
MGTTVSSTTQIALQKGQSITLSGSGTATVLYGIKGYEGAAPYFNGNRTMTLGPVGSLGAIVQLSAGMIYNVINRVANLELKQVDFALTWDTNAAKDMGEQTITAAVALISSDVDSNVGGYTVATFVADGSHTPTVDGVAISGWVTTSGAHNEIKLRRSGNSKFWTCNGVAGAAITLPVQAQITTAGILQAISTASAVAWSGAVVTGSPTPTVTYQLSKNGTVVSTSATSGSYTNFVAGDYFDLLTTAFNGVGPAVSASCPTITATAPTVTYDIIPLMGQSNMAGRGVYNSSIDTVDANVFQFDGWADSPTYRTIIQAQDRLKHPELTALSPGQTLVGPGMFYGKAHAAATGRKVLLVPVAWGGTSILGTGANSTWSPYGSGNNRDFLNAIDQVNRAIAAAPGSTVSAILWFQGEGDASNFVTGPAYAQAVKDVFAGLRAGITGAANVPIIASHLVPETIANQVGSYAEVDAALSSVADIAKTTIIAGVSGQTSDNLHYNAAQARATGTSMYAARATALANAGQTVAPGQVTGLTAGTSTATSIPFTFTAPSSGGSVSDYQMQVSPTGAGTWVDFVDGFGISTSINVTGLTSSTTYDFRIRANNYGTNPNGAWSSTVTVATASSSLTDSNVRLTHITGTKITETGSSGAGWVYTVATAAAFGTDSAGTSSTKMPAGVDGAIRMAYPSIAPSSTDTFIIGLVTAQSDPVFSAGATGYKFGLQAHGSLIYRVIVDGAASSTAGNLSSTTAVQNGDIMRFTRSAGVIKGQIARSSTPTTWIDIHQFAATSNADLWFAFTAANTSGATVTPGAVIGTGWA